jgi:diadenosine tetraphosphate (Ap4A) HIT family hydrolase
MNVVCVFCEIVRGAEPASVVWEDELTMAFMDRRQFHPGHTLVIPRQHKGALVSVMSRYGLVPAAPTCA